MKKDIDIITISWCTEDVISRASDRGIPMDKYAARAILRMMKEAHDCGIGINWDVVDYHTDNYLADGGII